MISKTMTAAATTSTMDMTMTMDNCSSQHSTRQHSAMKKKNVNVDDSTHSTASTTSMSSTESNNNNNSTCCNSNNSTTDDDSNNSNSTIVDESSTKQQKHAKPDERRVRFGSLEIHEHAVELGGSGVPVCGPPTTLEWNEQSYFMIQSVEKYEDLRPCLPRKGSELLQPKSQRISMLLRRNSQCHDDDDDNGGGGYSLREINECIKDNNIIRQQRARTIQRQQRAAVFSNLFKKIGQLRRKRTE